MKSMARWQGKAVPFCAGGFVAPGQLCNWERWWFVTEKEDEGGIRGGDRGLGLSGKSRR